MTQRILYVDDDRANVVVFRAAFADELDVVTAASGAQALDVLRRDRDIALLVTDQRMPGMTGVELAEIVRRDHPDVVRYLITAYADLEAAIDAINLGQVQRYLRKPWDRTELRLQLREGLELFAMRRRVRDLERRLREVERVYALGVVAASVVHELRNPMSVVLGYVDVARHLLDQLGHPGVDLTAVIAELEHSIDGTEEAANRMGEIVRGVELSTRRGAAASADLGEVTELTLRLVINELRHRAVTAIDVARGVRVPVPPTQLGQVTLNLLVNAVQAVPDRGPVAVGRIRVTVSRTGDRGRLEVSDNGPGVPDSLKARIFDPFFTTKADGGTGLGLAISRQIVEEAGGALTVEDTPGGGATFVVDLPIDGAS
jgi:two-component system, NtrC family, sensor kinase